MHSKRNILPDIDHGKFFVIVGVSDDSVVGFFINSNINPSIFGKQKQLDMQYPMKHSDYDFLKYDSFLCVTEIKKIKMSDLMQGISDKVAQCVGQMRERHIGELLRKARQSKLFSPRDKKLFLHK